MATSTQDAEHERRTEGKEKSKVAPHSLRAATPTPNRKTRDPTTQKYKGSNRRDVVANPRLANPGSDQVASDSPNNLQSQSQSHPAVRFKSTIEEIAAHDAAATTSHPLAPGAGFDNPGQVTPEQIRELSNRLRAVPLQERRMNIFSYEPVSLPVSRVRIGPFRHYPVFA